MDEVVTSVKAEFQGWGWVLALCCCAGIVCAVVPCCMDDLNEYKHRCPKKCGYTIGSYTPQGSGKKILTGILILGICFTVGVIILRFGANVQFGAKKNSPCLKFPPHFCQAKWPAHAQPIGPDGTCVTKPSSINFARPCTYSSACKRTVLFHLIFTQPWRRLILQP